MNNGTNCAEKPYYQKTCNYQYNNRLYILTKARTFLKSGKLKNINETFQF